jgi:hypothetical protein
MPTFYKTLPKVRCNERLAGRPIRYSGYIIIKEYQRNLLLSKNAHISPIDKKIEHVRDH